MKKRAVLIALQILLIVSTIALLFTKALDHPLALYVNLGIVAFVVIVYLLLARCPHCKKHNRLPFLLRKPRHCYHCGNLIEFE